MKPIYYSTLTKTFHAVGSECRYGIIPIENTIDGHVQVTLDLIAQGDLKIIHEITLPIDFVFVSKHKRLEDVKRLFVQFKTHNQCLNFIESIGDTNIITTPSNSISYKAYLEDDTCDAVIIPSHRIDSQICYSYRVDHVADSIDNETRFVILSNNLNDEQRLVHWRTSFSICSEKDRPGLLSEILNIFSKRNINLRSITSRPQKNGLGNYIFFIEIEGCYQRNKFVKESIEEISEKYKIKVFGSYYEVQSVDKQQEKIAIPPDCDLHFENFEKVEV